VAAGIKVDRVSTVVAICRRGETRSHMHNQAPERRGRDQVRDNPPGHPSRIGAASHDRGPSSRTRKAVQTCGRRWPRSANIVAVGSAQHCRHTRRARKSYVQRGLCSAGGGVHRIATAVVPRAVARLCGPLWLCPVRSRTARYTLQQRGLNMPIAIPMPRAKSPSVSTLSMRCESC